MEDEKTAKLLCNSFGTMVSGERRMLNFQLCISVFE